MIFCTYSTVPRGKVQTIIIFLVPFSGRHRKIAYILEEGKRVLINALLEAIGVPELVCT